MVCCKCLPDCADALALVRELRTPPTWSSQEFVEQARQITALGLRERAETFAVGVFHDGIRFGQQFVSTLITRLFGEDYLTHAELLHSYAARWNILNLFRMALVGTSIIYMFNAFRQLDRAGKCEHIAV